MASAENPITNTEAAEAAEAEADKPEEVSEAKLIAQLAAELATPMEVEPDPEPSSAAATPGGASKIAGQAVESQAESAISPERLAMRQLQGRLRKNLLLKRPVRTSSDETESAPADASESPESPIADSAERSETETEREAVVSAEPTAALPIPSDTEPESEPEPAVSPSVELVTQPDPDTLPEAEVSLVTHEDTETGLRSGEIGSEAPVSEAEPASFLKREVIRIEKSSESFTHLHTAIEYAVGNPNFHTDGLTDSSLFQSNRPVVLGVTSAVDGEGKTTVALHLAMDIARNNFKKVCLIDMSLGEDTLSRRLEINTGSGLVHVLEGTNHTIPTIETVKYESLSIMPAGKTPENPARAARSPLVLETLTAARKLFDVIIVDMPSIASGNVLPIAPHLDAAVMVVYAGVTPKEIVAGALERLERSKVLGVVLNRVTTAMPSWLQRRMNRW